MAEEQRYTDREFHSRLAVDLNNAVWEMLGKEVRTHDEDEAMIHTAHASYYHWSVIGTEVNRARGEWLVSHVYAVLNMSHPAIHHANICMAITRKEKLGDFDLAYAYEGLARANACAGDRIAAEGFLTEARVAAELIENPEDRKLFLSDLAAEPWYGIHA